MPTLDLVPLFSPHLFICTVRHGQPDVLCPCCVENIQVVIHAYSLEICCSVTIKTWPKGCVNTVRCRSKGPISEVIHGPIAKLQTWDLGGSFPGGNAVALAQGRERDRKCTGSKIPSVCSRCTGAVWYISCALRFSESAVDNKDNTATPNTATPVQGLASVPTTHECHSVAFLCLEAR